MGTLTNKLIDQTYEGLIKTADEGAIDGTDKRLQDGLGNNLPVAASSNGMVYYGNQDFTNATVTGIQTGGAIVAATVTFSTSTTVAQNQLVSQVEIPANTFSADGDVLQLKGNVGYRFGTNPQNSGTVRIYLGTSNTYDPTVNHALGYQEVSTAANDGFMLPVNKTLTTNADTYFAAGANYASNNSTASPDIQFYDLDFPTTGQLTYEAFAEINWSIPQFLSVVFDVNNSGDTATVYGLALTKIN